MSITDHEPTGVVVRERAPTAVPGAVGLATGLLLLAGAVWAGFARSRTRGPASRCWPSWSRCSAPWCCAA